MSNKIHGEGNHEADQRYRKAVRETVAETTDEERARRARDMTDEEKAEADKAAKEAESVAYRQAK